MLELDVQVWLGIEATQVNAAEEEGESEPVHVQHTASHATINHLEQVGGNDGETLSIVADFLESSVVVQHGMEDVEEEVQRVLVEEVDLTQRVQREVNVAASLRQRQVLLGHRLDLADHLVRLFHLLADLGRLFFQRL